MIAKEFVGESGRMRIPRGILGNRVEDCTS